jgi:hypothetical protein
VQPQEITLKISMIQNTPLFSPLPWGDLTSPLQFPDATYEATFSSERAQQRLWVQTTPQWNPSVVGALSGKNNPNIIMQLNRA